MKTLILYSSDYRNNTERIAQLFAEKTDCDLVKIKDAKNVNMDGYDLIGFGSGVYRESLSPKLSRLVDHLDVQGKKVFVYSTSGAGLKYYNNPLVKQLESKGAINKGSFACKGSFAAKEFTENRIFDLIGKLSQGHPNKKDFKKAERFITKITASI
jgi:flavodoxin